MTTDDALKLDAQDLETLRCMAVKCTCAPLTSTEALLLHAAVSTLRSLVSERDEALGLLRDWVSSHDFSRKVHDTDHTVGEMSAADRARKLLGEGGGG